MVGGWRVWLCVALPILSLALLAYFSLGVHYESGYADAIVVLPRVPTPRPRPPLPAPAPAAPAPAPVEAASAEPAAEPLADAPAEAPAPPPPAVPAAAPPATKSIFVITVTGMPQLEKALQMQASLQQTLGPTDRDFTACGEECAQRAAGRLHGLVVVPETMFPGSRCTHTNGERCSGYKESSIKYPYAWMKLWKERKASGEPMPAWWLLKDTDTYVHMTTLRAGADQYDSNQLLMLGQRCGGPCGGGGLLFSAALAEKIITQFGERMMKHMVTKITTTNDVFWWDANVAHFLEWAGAQQVDLPMFQTHGPFTKPFCKGDADPPNLKCHRLDICRCARTERPATWHLRDDGNFDGAMQVLDNFYGLAHSAPAAR